MKVNLLASFFKKQLLFIVICFFGSLFCFITSCNTLTGNNPNDTYLDIPFTQNELNFIPYELHDTIKLVNTGGSQHKFICTYKNILTTTTYYKDSPNVVERKLKCVFKDQSSIDSIYLLLDKRSYTTFDICYFNFSSPWVTSSNIEDSLKKFYPPALYMDSVKINGTEYYEVIKLINIDNRNDTTYYSPKKGLLQFNLSANNETWMKE